MIVTILRWIQINLFTMKKSRKIAPEDKLLEELLKLYNIEIVAYLLHLHIIDITVTNIIDTINSTRKNPH